MMIASLLVDGDRYPLDDEAGAERFREQFAAGCYVRFPGFFRPEGFALLEAEVLRLRRLAIRRDLQMQGSGGSPRKMSTLGGHVVAAYSSLIPLLYRDPALLRFLSWVAGDEVLEVPDPVENHVLNVLHQVGDIHGGHVDTYAFAFNIFIEAPAEGGGGLLEFVPGSTELADLEGPSVMRLGHRPGDCYLLKTDEAVHRVSPLTRPGCRTIVNMAYADPATVNLESYSTSSLYGSEQIPEAFAEQDLPVPAAEEPPVPALAAADPGVER